ncbi:MAG: hypothetical protein GY765_31000 [bacterium]|nr:hypothetical protein [bacterium]
MPGKYFVILITATLVFFHGYRVAAENQNQITSPEHHANEKKEHEHGAQDDHSDHGDHEGHEHDGHGDKEKEPKKKLISGLSLILDMSCVGRNISDPELEALEIPGYHFGHSHDDSHIHSVQNEKKGFNLNYGELVLTARVDSYFDVFAAFHLSENSFEIEEAYVVTRSLPFGFRLKAGKFFSDFGNINSLHSHGRSFSYLPLVHRAFFGDHGVQEKGVQLSWTAPLDFHFSVAVEALQGENSGSFGTEGFRVVDEEQEKEVEIPSPPLPNVWNFILKTGFQVKQFHFSAGVSYITGKSRFLHFDEEHPHGFSGDNNIPGLDLTLAYSIDEDRYLLFQGEYLSRENKGFRYDVLHPEEEDDHGLRHGVFRADGEDEHGHEAGVPEVEIYPFRRRQAGLYAQLLFRFHRLCQVGVRWDDLFRNRIQAAGESSRFAEDVKRYSVVFDYDFSKYSRLRLQYTVNRFGFLEGERRNYNELALHLMLKIGSHGSKGPSGHLPPGASCSHPHHSHGDWKH